MKIKLLLGVVFVLLTGCSINHNKFAVESLDLEKSEYYPLEEELLAKPALMLVAIDKNFEDLFKARLEQQLRNYFWKISKVKLAFTDFQSLQLLEQQAADKIAAYYAVLAVSQDSNKVKVLFKTNSGTEITSLIWEIDNKKSNKNLQQQIAINFSLSGFVVITKGNRKVAKINLGQNFEIKKGNKFAVFTRTITGEWKKNKQGFLNKYQINYSQEPVAEIKVIAVEKDFAWCLVKSADKLKIRAGMPVFAIK